MAYEDIFDPIEVTTHFRGGRMIPRQFFWNGRIYRIKNVNGQWKEKLGMGQQIHFSVQAEDSNCFELIFDTHDFNWQLARVYLEG